MEEIECAASYERKQKMVRGYVESIAARNSEGRLFQEAGAACIVEIFLGDFEMRKMRKYGGHSHSE